MTPNKHKLTEKSQRRNMKTKLVRNTCLRSLRHGSTYLAKREVNPKHRGLHIKGVMNLYHLNSFLTASELQSFMKINTMEDQCWRFQRVWIKIIHQFTTLCWPSTNMATRIGYEILRKRRPLFLSIISVEFAGKMPSIEPFSRKKQRLLELKLQRPRNQLLRPRRLS